MRRLRASIRSMTAAILLIGALLLPTIQAGVPLGVAAPATAPAAGPDTRSPYGIAGVMRWPDWGSFSKPADAFLQTGGSWVREDFAWGLIQPSPDRFDWTATDRIVGTLAEDKVSILGIIAYSANWATGTKADDGSAVSFYPPDLDKYAQFVKTLVGRYKHAVHHWEIWNEPDNGMFWKPAPNAREYAAVLKTAYKAVKEADPNAKVLSAGVSGNAVPFLEEMLAAGAADSFDILGLHPYAVPLNPSQGRIESRPEVHKMLDVELTKYRAFLQRHGMNRPIWITEIGWPAHDWGLDDSAQASYLAQTYALLLSSGLVEKIFWYSFKDMSANPSVSWGLLGWGSGMTDLAPKRPSFAAYATSAHLLAGASPAGRIPLGTFATVEGFEQSAVWARSTHNEGALAVAGDQKHGGNSSGKLQYNFGGANQAVDFAPPQPVALPGSPTRIGLWVLGDGSGNYLSAWLKDNDGELFKVRLGAVTGAADGWRYYESAVQNHYFDWERAGGNPANGRPDYPLAFVSFRLENTPDEPAGNGTIYVDDLQTYDGPDVTAVRFVRGDGSAVDVLWSAQPVEVALASTSQKAQVFSRDGAETTVDAKGGAVPVKTSESPVYVVHKPTGLTTKGDALDTTAGTQAQRTASPEAMCAAAGRTDAVPGEVLYFPESGHNLYGAFKGYWEANGGINILGFPVTEEFDAPSSDGKVYRQQIFERARLEYHPENSPPADVQVGLLGVWVARDRNFPRSERPAGAFSGLFFAETGQALGTFKDWWYANGGLPAFGFPISPEMQEKNAADGQQYTVQYFERNRLELHPEFKGTQREVMLGLLGTEYLAHNGCK